MKRCNFCGKKNTEVQVHKLKPGTISDWIALIFTLGLFRHELCQSCASKIFRGYKKGV
jgi:hypothetical protein